MVRLTSRRLPNRNCSQALIVEEFVHTERIESDNYFFSDHNGGSGIAAVSAHHFEHGRLVMAHVAFFVDDTSRREVGLNKLARWSTGLGEEENARHQDCWLSVSDCRALSTLKQ